MLTRFQDEWDYDKGLSLKEFSPGTHAVRMDACCKGWRINHTLKNLTMGRN